MSTASVVTELDSALTLYVDSHNSVIHHHDFTLYPCSSVPACTLREVCGPYRQRMPQWRHTASHAVHFCTVLCV